MSIINYNKNYYYFLAYNNDNEVITKNSRVYLKRIVKNTKLVKLAKLDDATKEFQKTKTDNYDKSDECDKQTLENKHDCIYDNKKQINLKVC